MDNRKKDLIPNKKNPLSLHLDISKLMLASEEEKSQSSVMRESHTFFHDAMKRFFKNKIAVICGIVVLFIVAAIIVLPLVWPYSYDAQLGIVPGMRGDSSFNNLKPFEYGATELARIEAGEKVFPHVFGTDDLGRDYFIRVIYGTRVSLGVGLFASILVLIIGMLYGSISGYVGGRCDMIMMRVVDIIYSLPDLLMVILISVALNSVFKKMDGIFAKLGPNMISIFIVFGLLYWVSMARLIRGQILSLKKQEYVLAAQSIGASTGRIIFKHLLPNCLSIIIITTALQVPSAIFTESFLSFLGLGVSMPMPSLGSLASSALDGVFSYTYRLVIPALVICIIVLSLNLLGDGLRDAFDPKLKN